MEWTGGGEDYSLMWMGESQSGWDYVIKTRKGRRYEEMHTT